jgi:hypothetical protein
VNVLPKGYEDLGLVIDVTNLGIGQLAASEWFDGMTWARGLLLSTNADGTFTLNVESRDSHGHVCILSSGSGIFEGVDWTNISLPAPQSLGFGFRIVVVNEDETPASVHVAVQVVS